MSKQNYNPLHHAAYRGRLLQVKKLVEKGGMNVNEKCKPEQESPLFISCLNGHLDVAKYLIEKGADPNKAINRSGLCPLQIAASKGHFKVVELLVENTPDIDTVLVKAVGSGNLQLLKYLIQMRNVDVRCSTLLFKAAQKGYLDIIVYLIEQGADINVQVNSSTPLIAAIRKNNVKVVKLLLDHGADPNLVPLQSFGTPLLEAVITNNTEIVSYLIKYNAGCNSPSHRLLHLSFRQGNLDIFKMLALNSDIKTIKPTLLKIATTFKNTKISKFINELRTYNWDIFEVVRRNKKDFVPHIVSRNILDQPDRDGNTLLHLAVLYNRFMVAGVLLEAGANPNIINEVGNTALILAIRAENHPMVALLLKYDVDVNLSAYSNTPLFEATQNENFHLVKMLVEKGARLNERFPHINDLIDKVAESGQYEKIKFLIGDEGIKEELSGSDCAEPESVQETVSCKVK